METIETNATLPKSLKLKRVQVLLTNTILSAAVQSIGQITVERNFQTIWWDQKVITAVSMRRNCLKALRSCGTTKNLEH